MCDAFEFVYDVQQFAVNVTRTRQPITSFLKQTIECCVFIREYVRRGFASEFVHSSPYVTELTGLPIERMVGVSGRKVAQFEKSFAALRQRIEDGVNVSSAAFLSMRSTGKIVETGSYLILVIPLLTDSDPFH